MWTITGHFDGDPIDDDPNTLGQRTKMKLLKCDTKYPITRKPNDGVKQLCIPNKRVSTDHGYLLVGAHSADDVYNPAFIPSLTLHNTRKNPCHVYRGPEADDRLKLAAVPGQPFDLEDGDEICFTSLLRGTVNWLPMTFYLPSPSTSKAPLPAHIESIAALGLKLTHSLGLDADDTSNGKTGAYNFHLTPTLKLAYSTAVSLLTVAGFAKTDFISTFVRLGSSNSGADGPPSSLEKTYVAPVLSKHRPAYDPSLPEALQRVQVWEPDEKRWSLFRGARFVFVLPSEGDAGTQVYSILGDNEDEDGEKITLKEVRHLVRLGGGKSELFGLEDNGGRLGFARMLSKGKVRRGRLVVVADKRSLGEETWDGLVEEAKGLSLRILPTPAILNAIAHASIDPLDSDLNATGAEDLLMGGSIDTGPQTGQSSHPDFIPNTHSQEPTAPPPSGSTSRSPRLRRGGSRPPDIESQPVAPNEVEESQLAEPKEAEPPRKRLLRRTASASGAAGPSNVTPAAGAEPTNTVEGGAGAMEVDAAPPETRAPPLTARRLNRRTRTTATAVNAGLTPELTDSSIAMTSQDIYNALTGGTSLGTGAGTKRKTPEPDSELMPPPKVPGSATRPRLKRRTGTTATASSSSLGESPLTQLSLPTPVVEPPHKKFKALFDESDPARSGGIILDMDYDDSSQTQTQTQSLVQSGSSLGSRTRTALGGLAAVAEEEEESQVSQLPDSARGANRRDGDAEQPMDETNTAANGPTQSAGTATLSSGGGRETTPVPPAGKPPTIPTTPFKTSSIPNSPHKRPGAAPGNPDTDEAFLKALASTRKTRNTKNSKEDAFDREFNALRISKPELEKEREKREAEAHEEMEDWKTMLHEFGDEVGLRGNFMVVMECEVHREKKASQKEDGGEGGPRVAGGAVNPAWAGRSDFKKFRKKGHGAFKAKEAPVVEVFAEEPEDFGMGAGYWKSANSQAQSQNEPVFDLTQSQSAGSSKRKRSRSRSRIPSGGGLGGSHGETEAPAPKRARSRPLDTTQIEFADVVLDEDLPPPPTARTRGTRAGSQGREITQSTAATTLPSQSQRSTRARGRTPNLTPLFLPSQDGESQDVEMALREDDEDDEDKHDGDYDQLTNDDKMSDDDTGTRTLRSTAPTNSGTRSRRSTQQTQGMKPPSSTASGKPRVGSRRAPVMLLDDDDEASFKGFKKGRTRTQQ